ncbi:MAG: hypothetical protein MSA02_01950 [Bacteroidales bacterium]|nr:hypothetical protein [Bacteroidales bacterium]
MKKTIVIALSLFLALPSFAASKESKDNAPVKEHLQNHFKFYGFIRNFFAFDTRESTAGTGDLFYYLPKDQKLNELGDDLNAMPSFRFLALTSRVGVDVSGYQVGSTSFGAKFEADFYSGLSSSATSSKINGAAQLRLRQAYVTIGWKDLPMSGDAKAAVSLKIGQAWHPMAADQPHVLSLETGAPFGQVSRTPQVTMDANLGKHVILTASAIWQQQYLSQGPSGASAEYIKYSCTPEGYLGVSFKSDNGFLARIGSNVLSIKPRRTGLNSEGVEVKVSDRITTFSPFIYLQYKSGKFEAKAKSTFSQAGEHMNLMSGYGITGKFDDGHYEYAPIQTSSTWASVSYGKKWQFMLMGGYIKNLGATKDFVNKGGVTDKSDFYFSGNGSKNLNSMWRVIPAVTYNIGKFTLGLEYNVTAAQYGDGKSYNARGLSLEGLHWVYNNRIQAMVKFTF